MRAVTSIVIGAGQAGLAMSRALSRRDVDHLVLDRDGVATAWRKNRWDSLRLLTPNWASALPGDPYRAPDPHGYMRVGELVANMEAYAHVIGAPVRTETEVRRVTGNDAGFQIETNQGRLAAKTLVLATGACAKPLVPSLAAAVPPRIVQTTASAYKRPDDLPGGDVLVVGASASGVQLARELQMSGRQVTLAAGWCTRLPRAYRGRDIEWWLEAIGALDERYDEVEDLERARRTPSPQLIGGPEPVDLNGLRDRGVEIAGQLAEIRDGHALFSGGLANVCASADLKMNRVLDAVDAFIAERGLDVSAPDRPEPTRLPGAPALKLSLTDGRIRSIVWATGYRPDFSWLDMPVFDARGRLLHSGGVVATPGLYAMGLTFMRRRKSHQLSGVGSDADELSTHLRAFLDGSAGIAA